MVFWWGASLLTVKRHDFRIPLRVTLIAINDVIANSREWNQLIEEVDLRFHLPHPVFPMEEDQQVQGFGAYCHPAPPRRKLQASILVSSVGHYKDQRVKFAIVCALDSTLTHELLVHAMENYRVQGWET